MAKGSVRKKGKKWYYRFQFVQLHAPAAGTRLAVRMDGAAQVKNTVGVR